MNVNELIGYASAAIIGIAGIVFMESIKSLISTYFSNLNRRQVSNLFYILLLVAIVAPAGLGNLTASEEQEPVPEEKTETEVPPATKTEAEVYLEAAEIAVDMTSQAIENKRARDSAFAANRRNFWAYQIGTPKNRDAAWELYQKIKHIPGICFYKEGRKTYRVIKYDGHSEQLELENSLVNLKEQLTDMKEEVQIIDLMTECRRKEDLEESKLKNGEDEVRCFECKK